MKCVLFVTKQISIGYSTYLLQNNRSRLFVYGDCPLYMMYERNEIQTKNLQHSTPSSTGMRYFRLRPKVRLGISYYILIDFDV